MLRLSLALAVLMGGSLPAQAQVLTIPAAEYIRLENANYQPKDSGVIHAALIGLNMVEVTEFGLTMYALGTGRLHEANKVLAPLTKSPAAVLIVKSGVDSALTLGLWKLHEKKPRLAVGLAIVGIVGYGAVAVHNYQQLERIGPRP